MPEPELTAAALAKRLQILIRRPQQLTLAAHAAHGLGRPEAARALADMVERLAPRKTPQPGNGGGGGKIISLPGVRRVAA